MSTYSRWLQSAGILLGGMFFALPAAAATTAQPGSHFIVDSWSTKEGLPQSSVISVIQTRDGYLWLGTLNGLVRFDGDRFTVFDEENTPGLNSDRIIYLFEDSHTNLWIGTDTTGAGLLQDGKIKNFEIGRAGEEGKLMSVCEDATGAVWFYTADSHLAHYQNGKMEVVNFNFLTPPICRMIATDKSGELWVADVSQIISIRPDNFNPRAIVVDGEPVRVARLDYILASRNGGVWRFMNGGVQKWKSGSLEKDFGAYPWGDSVVKAACEDKDGKLIVGTWGAGVFWFDANGKYERISTEQGLSSAFVLSLCTDREENLWVGTDGGGLNRVKRKIFNSPVELPAWPVQSASEDALGGLWTAFNAHGLTYWHANSAQDFSIGIFSNAWSVLVDHQQQIWAGTRGEGLFHFETNSFQPAPGAEILGPWIYALFQDRHGQLWAGTKNGLALWDGRDWKIFTTRDGLSENTIRALAEDAGENLWVGTENRGLNFFKDGKFIAYQQSADGLPGNDISALYLDKDGVLWIGTFGHGLARFRDGKWTRFSMRAGLASNSIGYIIEDDQGNLWIGSNAGLMRIRKQSLNDFAEGKAGFISCRTFGEADGLLTRECSIGAQPAALRARDGRLWFPTVKGLVSVDPAALKPNLQPPSIIIESARVDGREQKTNLLASVGPQSITIAPGNKQLAVQLEIHYTALNFTAPDEVRFKYRLEGHETAWTDVGNNRAAYYSEVPPGHYRFHVTACNEDGVWNPNGSFLDITVEPQFWQTGGFRAAVIIFFLGLIVAAVRYLSTQKLQRQLQSLKHREALERERSRIARDLHDQLGANLTQVALLGELAEADKNAPDEIESHARQISQTARETTRSLDEIVWAVNPANDTLDGLVNYACKYAQEYLTLAGLRCRADVPSELPATAIPPEVRHNAFLAFKEAVNNVVKHAQATEAWIRLRLQPDSFILEIEDNGRGLGNQDAGGAGTRNGLRNMRKRMEDIHGEFSIGPGAKGGTVVRLTVPISGLSKS